MASTSSKQWNLKRFIKLAEKLNQVGWDAKLLLPFTEAFKIQNTIDHYSDLFILTSTVDELARYLYESGYFIGNDSGPGHLASNLGIPVLTTVIKKVTVWRADWELVHLVSAPLWSCFKTKKYRKFALTVNRVKRAFDQMVFEYESKQRTIHCKRFHRKYHS